MILKQKVENSRDDGYWYSTTFTNNTPLNRIGRLSTLPVTSFYRFNNLTFGGTINKATVKFKSAGNTKNNVHVLIYAELSNNPSYPVSAEDGNARVLTSNNVSWEPGSWDANVYYSSIDITNIIQELLDEGYKYDGSQSIVIYLICGDTNTNRSVRGYDHDSENSSAELEIDYISANTPPTVTLKTKNTITLSKPLLQFKADDPENDDVTYQLQISDNASFLENGVQVTDSLTDNSKSELLYCTPLSDSLTWQGEIQLDNRPGQSFKAIGGILDKVRFKVKGTGGEAIVRLYRHDGDFGLSSMPDNLAAPNDTPTPNWLVESERVEINSGNLEWVEFIFTEKIRLGAGEYYMVILDWIPDTDNNIIIVEANADIPHKGNAYIDGNSNNNGVNLKLDVLFEVYEDLTRLDKVSNGHSGFLNLDSKGNTDPFNAGESISYTITDSLDKNVIYYWRVKAIDSKGSNLWGKWSAIRTFNMPQTPPENQPGGSVRVGIGF